MLLLPTHNQNFQTFIYKESSGLASKLSALEVLHNNCNMGTCSLPEMFACSPQAVPSDFECSYISDKLFMSMLQL